MSTPSFSDLTDALSAPVGDLIASVGRSMAEAQQAMDAATIANFKEIYSEDGEAFEALRKLGYRPTWYQIPEVSAEVKLALTVSGAKETQSTGGGGRPVLKSAIRLYANPVDATLTNKYGFNYQASSKVTFRIVPVPPSAAAEGMQVVPKLEGITLSEAEARLRELGIAWEVSPESAISEERSELITKQQPAPGEIIRADENVVLEI